MKSFAKITLVIVTACNFSSCSLQERWGVSRPFKIIGKEYSTVGTRKFVTRRYLLAPDSRETFIETLEVR